MVQRGYLGITIRSLDGNLAKEQELDITEGVYVDSVLDKSAADNAGIKEGDVIVEINGNEVKKSAELLELIARQRPGDKVDITVYRDGKNEELSAILQSREGSTKTVTKPKGEVLASLGAELKTVSKDKAAKLNIDGGVQVIKHCKLNIYLYSNPDLSGFQYSTIQGMKNSL